MKFHVLMLLGALALASCAEKESAAPAAPAAPSEPKVALPATLFATPAPADAKPLSEVRATAKAGEVVTFVGYIGGREEPFVDGRAMMLVADKVKAPACTDACKIPWDACCTPAEDIVANSATVQVVDEAGAPLKVGLMGQGNLGNGSSVAVTGKVREIGEGIFVVDAQTIAALPAATP